MIIPLFVARCSPCHAGESPVSELGLDTSAAIHKGGYGGPSVTPGDPTKSLVMARLVVPMSDAEHMPPEGNEQLTPDQIELVRQWIVAGADDRDLATAALSPGQQRAIAVLLPTPLVPLDASTSSSSTGSGDPTSSSATGGGEVPPVHGSGCASCAFEPSPEDAALALASSIALALVVVGRRKRRS